jgi:hypothetical protein
VKAHSRHVLAGRFDDAHLLLTSTENLPQRSIEHAAEELDAIGRLG